MLSALRRTGAHGVSLARFRCRLLHAIAVLADVLNLGFDDFPRPSKADEYLALMLARPIE
jgi:hypothetical protein